LHFAAAVAMQAAHAPIERASPPPLIPPREGEGDDCCARRLAPLSLYRPFHYAPGEPDCRAAPRRRDAHVIKPWWKRNFPSAALPLRARLCHCQCIL